MKSHLSAMIILIILSCYAHAGESARQPGLVGQGDTTRINLLNRMAFGLRETDHEVTFKYATEALDLAQQLEYPRGKAAALGNLGWVYYRRADFVEALHYSIEAMKISEQIGDKSEMARSMNNIASVSYEQKQYGKALAEFKKALALSNESGDERVTGRTLNNIAYIFLTVRNETDSAEYYSRRALAHGEKIRDSYLVAFALRSLGDVFERKGQYEEALKVYQRVVDLAEASLNNFMKAATLHRIATVFQKQERYSEAIRILEDNAVEARRKGYLDELERTYKLLSEVNVKLGRYGAAYSFLHQYTILHDSIYNQHGMRQIALVQNQFDLDMKQAQIELLMKDAALKQEEIAGQRSQLYAIIVASSCFLLLVMVMLYSYQKVHQSNVELHDQKEELARKNLEVIEKSNELGLLNNTKDKLLSIIGHDFRSPLQSLRGILRLIGKKSMTQPEFERYSKELLKKIDNVYDNLDNVLTWSVGQLKGIQTQPVFVYPSQVVAEVFELYAEMARVKKVMLTNDIQDSVALLADKDQVRLVIRNLVSNALKFTPASGFVRVGARVFGREVTIFVQDSGVGIAAHDLDKLFVKESLWSAKGTNDEKGLGLGLLLCKEFIERNNGSLDIKSEQGAGTTISFALPAALPTVAPQEVYFHDA